MKTAQYLPYLPFTVASFCLVACCVLAWNLAEAAVAERRARMVNSIIDRTVAVRYDNMPHQDTVSLADTELFGTVQPGLHAYMLRWQGELAAVVLLPVRVRGYHDYINLAVGMQAEGTVAGISVLSHSETTGIGDAAMRPGYTDIMLDRSLDSPVLTGWAVRREGGEFDQVSGATVSSRAVVRAVRDSLRVYAAERHRFSGGQ